MARRWGNTFFYRTPDLTKKSLTIATETDKVITEQIPINHCGYAVIPITNASKKKKIKSYLFGDKVSINGSSYYDVTNLPLTNEDIKCVGKVTYKIPVN